MFHNTDLNVILTKGSGSAEVTCSDLLIITNKCGKGEEPISVSTLICPTLDHKGGSKTCSPTSAPPGCPTSGSPRYQWPLEVVCGCVRRVYKQLANLWVNLPAEGEQPKGNVST